MSKRALGVFLILALLLAMPSCSLDELTDTLAKLNENVLGGNPENVTAANEKVENTTTPTNKNDNKEEFEKFQSTVNTIAGALAGEGATIELPDTVLANVSREEISDLAGAIEKAANADSSYVESMKEAAEDKTQIATKGTAELVTTIVNQLTESGSSDTGITIPDTGNEELNDLLTPLADGINKITGKGGDGTTEEYAPTKADAVILQMTQSVVTTLAESLMVEDENGNMTIPKDENGDIKLPENPADLLTDENVEVIASALQTINTLAPSSAFAGLNIDYQSLLDTFLKGGETTGNEG